MPAETQTREDYGESIRSQGDPIPSSTGHESQASPAAENKRPVERPPPDEPGDRERTDPRDSDEEDRRADLVSKSAETQPTSAESTPNDAPHGTAEDEPAATWDADSGLLRGDPDQTEVLAADRGTDSGPLWHFHADFKGAHSDWYMEQDGHFTPGPDAMPTASRTGDAAPGERAGDLIANLEDARRSRADAFAREIVEEGENLPDAVRDVADPVRDFFARPASSAHAGVDSRPAVTHLAHDETDTGIALTGLALLSALAIKGVQLALQYWRQRKDEIGDQR